MLPGRHGVEGFAYDFLGVGLYLLQMVLTAEAFGVDLVDVLGAGGPGGEPAALGDHLDAADGRAVARGARSASDDLLAGQLGR